MIRLIRQQLLEWCYRTWYVGECDGILLANARPNDEEFVSTIVAAMKLVERTDALRFARIKRRIKWIINAPLFRVGGQYDHVIQACKIDFDPSVGENNRSLAIGWCASLLVHESTHGLLRGRGIPYSRRLRCRVERRCVKEEQRFVVRLAVSEPELARWLTCEFDESNWGPSWNATWSEKFAWAWAEVRKVVMRSWAQYAEPAEGSREPS